MIKKFKYLLIFFIIILINFSGCIEEKIDDSIKFSIISFKAEPSIINEGEKVILSWEVVRENSIIINNGIGSVSNKDRIEIYPHESSIYQLNAMNDTKIITARVEITVIKDINDSNDIERNINITPSMTVTIDESFNNIKIVSIESGVKWEYINISATDGIKNYYYTNPNNYVKQGDTIFFDGNGLSGIITIRFWYTPTNNLISTHKLNGVIP